MSDLILQFKDINKSFFGVPVLKQVSLELERGHILGLIGENGAGKSTLVNILGGVVPMDQGEMILNDQKYAPKNPSDATRSGVAFIHQELNLFTNLSITENLFINDFPTTPIIPFIKRGGVAKKTQDFLKLVDLNISPDTLVEKLSPGERQLVEVAKALSTDSSIIIFDEPTTSLTTRETERLFDIINRLHQAGKTIIYISHILADIMRLTDNIAVLRDGEKVGEGVTKDFTINKMISLMVGRDIEQLYPDREKGPTIEPIMEVKHLSKPGIVHDINLTLYKGEILGLFGLMGSGRSELAQIIFGIEPFDQGELIIQNKKIERTTPPDSVGRKMGFVTENRREEGLMMTSSVAANLGLVALPMYKRIANTLNENGLRKAVQDISKRLQIKSANIEKHEAKGLSGGNQQKVVLGKWLLNNPNILIVDEPTRGVDVGAKHEIYTIINKLADDNAGVLIISSEIEELMGVCDRIVVMGYGEMLGSFDRKEFNKEEILRMAFREYHNGKEN
jgi:ribose transport system ATP-binding protein